MRIYLQARFWMPVEFHDAENLPDSQDVNSFSLKGFRVVSGRAASERRAELALETETMSSLERWHVVHRIDENSPLWPIRHDLQAHLKAIDVSLSAYDTAFNQPVKLYVHYKKEEIVYNAHFAPMETTSDDGSITTVDHAKLDQIVQDAAPRPRVRKTCSLMRESKELVIPNLWGALPRSKARINSCDDRNERRRSLSIDKSGERRRSLDGAIHSFFCKERHHSVEDATSSKRGANHGRGVGFGFSSLGQRRHHSLDNTADVGRAGSLPGKGSPQASMQGAKGTGAVRLAPPANRTLRRSKSSEDATQGLATELFA